MAYYGLWVVAQDYDGWWVTKAGEVYWAPAQAIAEAQRQVLIEQNGIDALDGIHVSTFGATAQGMSPEPTGYHSGPQVSDPQVSDPQVSGPQAAPKQHSDEAEVSGPGTVTENQKRMIRRMCNDMKLKIDPAKLNAMSLDEGNRVIAKLKHRATLSTTAK